MPASLLGNLTYAGLQTILTTQASLGATSGNLFSINHGQNATTAPPDVALFQPCFLGAAAGAQPNSLPVVLYTRTGNVTVWYNPLTTAMAGDMSVQYFHSAIR